MHNEQIHEAWWSYLKGMFEDRVLQDIPPLFEYPHCGTCFHWFLINENGLHHLAKKASPREYDEIINDLSGKRLYDYKEHGEIKDHYRDYRFYGWCKRYPPAQRGGYSIIGFRSLFTFLNRHIPQKVAEYDFPLLPHDNQCGEWKKDDWVDNFVNKKTGEDQQPTAQ